MEKGKNRMLIESELRRDIYKTLNRENIGIPFPQQDVYLYSTKPIDVNIKRTDDSFGGNR